MNAHIVSADDKKTIIELDATKHLGSDDYEIFEANELTTGYKVKHYETGVMSDTGLRMYKINADLYDDLCGLYDKIQDIIKESLINGDGKFKYDVTKDYTKDEELEAIITVTPTISKSAAELFDNYFGEGTLKNIVYARLGQRFTPMFTFTIDVLVHLLGAVVLNSSAEIRNMTSKRRERKVDE